MHSLSPVSSVKVKVAADYAFTLKVNYFFNGIGFSKCQYIVPYFKLGGIYYKDTTTVLIALTSLKLFSSKVYNLPDLSDQPP